MLSSVLFKATAGSYYQQKKFQYWLKNKQQIEKS